MINEANTLDLDDLDYEDPIIESEESEYENEGEEPVVE
jgi:hypothetical protein